MSLIAYRLLEKRQKINNVKQLKGWGVVLILSSLVLIGLKLASIIDWTWAAVTAPIWVPVAVVAEIIIALILTKIIDF